MIIIRRNQEKFFSEFLEQKEFFNKTVAEKQLGKSLTDEEFKQIEKSLRAARKSTADAIRTDWKLGRLRNIEEGKRVVTKATSGSRDRVGDLNYNLRNIGKGWHQNVEEVAAAAEEDASSVQKTLKKRLEEVKMPDTINKTDIIGNNSSASNIAKDNFFKRNKKALLIGGGLTAAAGLGGLYMHNRDK